MLSQKTRSFLKDVLLVAAVFATMTGTYFGFAVTERYRTLTKAYIVQSEYLVNILKNQGATNGQESQPQVPSETDGQ